MQALTLKAEKKDTNVKKKLKWFDVKKKRKEGKLYKLVSRGIAPLTKPVPGGASSERHLKAFPGDPLLLVTERDDEIDESAEYKLV